MKIVTKKKTKKKSNDLPTKLLHVKKQQQIKYIVVSITFEIQNTTENQSLMQFHQ